MYQKIILCAKWPLFLDPVTYDEAIYYSGHILMAVKFILRLMTYKQTLNVGVLRGLDILRHYMNRGSSDPVTMLVFPRVADNT